jgi:hypothetical protein
MLGFLSLCEVPFGLKTASVPITAYGIGYWLWATSAAVVVASMGFEMIVSGAAAGEHTALKGTSSLLS